MRALVASLPVVAVPYCTVNGVTNIALGDELLRFSGGIWVDL